MLDDFVIYVGQQKDGFKFGMRISEQDFRNMIYDQGVRDNKVVWEVTNVPCLLDDTYGENWKKGKNWRGADMNIHDLGRISDHTRHAGNFLYRSDYILGDNPPVYSPKVISEWYAITVASYHDTDWCEVWQESTLDAMFPEFEDTVLRDRFYTWYFRPTNIKPLTREVYLEFGCNEK